MTIKIYKAVFIIPSVGEIITFSIEEDKYRMMATWSVCDGAKNTIFIFFFYSNFDIISFISFIMEHSLIKSSSSRAEIL